MEGVLHAGEEVLVPRFEQVGTGEASFDLVDAEVGQGHVAPMAVHGVVKAAAQPPDCQLRSGGEGLGVRGPPRHDEGDACLVDQDRIRLVDDGGGKRTMHLLLWVLCPLVAEKIEAELRGRGVGHVAPVRGLPFLASHPLADDSNRQPEEGEDAAHPFGIAPREIVVRGEDVHAGLRPAVPDDRGNGGEGLSLAGLHLDDRASGEGQGRLELDLEELEAEHPPSRLRCRGHDLGQRGGVVSGRLQLRVAERPVGSAPASHLAQGIGPGSLLPRQAAKPVPHARSGWTSRAARANLDG